MPAIIKRQSTINNRALVLDPAARLRLLSDHGSNVAIDKDIPIKRYFRSGSEMERQARVYYTEGQWDRAFILYNKFATLFIEKLPKHPEYSKAPVTDKTKIKKLIKQVLPRAMELKEKLKEKYEKEKEVEEAKKCVESDARTDESKADQSDEIAAFLGGQGGVAVIAAASDDRGGVLPPPQDDVGVRLPQSDPGMGPGLPPPQSDVGMKLQDSMDDTYTTPPQSGSAHETPPPFQTVPTAVVGDQFTPAPVPQQASGVPGDQSQSSVAALTATDVALAHVLPPSTAPPPYDPPPYDQSPSAPPPVTPLMVNMPPMAHPSTLQQVPLSYLTSHTGVHPLPPAQMTPPAVQPHPSLRQPTYESSLFQSPFSSNAAPPQATPPPDSSPFPGYQYTQQPYWAQTPPQVASPTYQVEGVAVSVSEERTGPPVIDRTTKPESLKALNTGTGFGGYRPVYIPADTAKRFEESASTNTNSNVETCGILAGKLSQNILHITHIIVPKQKGRADSCETLNEEEIFDVQDQYDLITLGWIHTHPTQTAFMSSVDLHCHCSYQIMMDEALAIVVAPKYQQVGYFMLTEPHGLNFITHCEEEGFHVHPKEPPLYEDCQHIHHDSNMFIQIVDLR